ncbi:MAG: virulence-associated E family protein [Pseudomonadota bacterium]
MAAWIDERQGVQNIYFTVNAVFGPVERKPNKGAVSGIRALHVDVDPRPGEDLDAERERAERVLREFSPPPTAIIDSGGGFQGFWLLREDVPVGGSAELARLFWREAKSGERGPLSDAERAEVDAHLARLWDAVEARNLKVEADLQGDACHNAERIMRLPGTINLPGQKKRNKGRTPRVAQVVDDDWTRRYRPEDFPAAPKPGGGAGAHLRAVSAAPARGVDLDALPVGDLCRRVIVRGHDPDNPMRWDGALDPDGSWRGDRSKVVFWVACEMVRRGCSEADILGVLLDPDLAISAHVRDQKDRESYARRQASEARESVDDSFVTDKDGKPVSNSQHNIRVALRRLGVSLWYDEFAGRDLVEGLEGYGPALDDAAAIRLRLEIDERFGFRPTKDFFYDVLSDTARRNARHPVLEYLAALSWDGVPRIGRWLVEYGGAADTPYTRAVGELVLVAAVRRVRRPGVKFDEMLVLESAQGTNKSTALKELAVRDEWFTDDLPLNAESKRVIEALSGKWIAEAGELKGNRKAGTDHLKGFLSRTHDKARMSYDRREREVPRQCVIVGTTNDSRYLRDTTGNRRFWPVAVEGFDLDALRRDRDQLWAEAAAREAEGVPIRLDPDLWADAEAEQDARRVEEPFYERLHDALGGERPGKVKAEDAWRIVGRQAGHRTQDDNERLGDAMRRLGFERTKRRFGLPHPEWCYVRGDGNVPRLVPRFGPEGDLEGVVETEGGRAEPF